MHEAVQKSCWIIISRTEQEKWLCSILIRPDGEWREETCLYWREQSLLLSVSFTLSPSFFFPNHGLPSGLTGRWKRLYRNNKPWEETMRETARWQNGRGGECEILWGLTGQHTCRSCPRISACAYFHHLDGSDLHHTRGGSNQTLDSVLKACISFLQRGEIFDISPIEPDWACRCSILWGLVLKDEVSFKITNPWQVLYVYLNSMAWSCPASSLVPRPVSAQSQCV